MTTLVNTVGKATAANEWPNLLPEAGTDRLHIVIIVTEVNGGVGTVDMPGTFTSNGVAYTLVDDGYAETSYLRGISLFAAKEADILSVEAGSGGIESTKIDGITTIRTTGGHFALSATYEDFDQSTDLSTVTVVAGGFATNGGAPLPHEINIPALTGDLVVAASLTTQPDTVTWAGVTGDIDQSCGVCQMSLASTTAVADATVTAGVSPDGGISYNTMMIGIALPPSVGPVNQAPVADDATFSVQEDVTNGVVVGTFTATDSDGTIASYSVTGTTLAIDNSGQITIADNTGITAGVDITATVTATDDDGDTDTALITVSVTPLVMSTDTITAGPIYEGDTVTIQLGNANNASGKTLSCPAGAITVTAQDINSISFSVFDLKIFGTKTLNYNEDIPVTVTDAGESDSINFQIAPTVGYDFAEITAATGIYADDVTVEVGDHGYGYFVAGTGTVDIPTGNFTADVHSSYKYWVRDASDGVWSDSATEVFQDPTGTYTAIGFTIDETDGSVYYGYTGVAPVLGDTIIHDPVTSPSGIGVTILDTGVWQLASMPNTQETFEAYILHGDGAYSTKSTFTFTPPDLTGPTLTLPTDTSTGETTGSGTVTTNDATGTLYFLASTNTTEDIATVKAGNSQAVTATGIQSVLFTGLTGGTTYYAHFVHTDVSGNNSNVSNATGFVTSAAPDTTAPILTSPTGSKTGQTTAAGSVTTDEAGGTLYYVITVNSSEVAATVLAGSQQAVLATGIQNVEFTSLTPGASYYIHYLQVDASSNEASVVSSAQFTTDSAIGLVISGTSTIRLGEVFTVTTTGTYDLTAAVTITATLGGVTLTGLTNITNATCDFTCPATGLSLVSPSDLIMTINI